MKVPNKNRAIITESKLVDYLLNPGHERGGSKAKKLLRYGYSPDCWQQLELDIRRFHLNADVSAVRETSYGVRYIVEAPLTTPIKRALYVRTVWQVDKGTDVPRLITLVPSR